MKQSMKSRICAGVLAIAISVAGTNIVMANQPDDETAMVDMYSIPEEYRTVDNFGPGFKDGVPADRVEGIELIVIEKSEHTVETVTATEEVEVVVSPVIMIDNTQDESAANNEVAEEASQEVIIVAPQNEQPAVEQVEEVKEEQPVEVSSTVSGNRWNISLTQEEMDVLAKIVWKEARGESDAGEQAVVEVVFNRMKSSNYPSSCIGVLSQRGQFSTWKGRNSAHPSEREYRNIMAVLNGQTNFLPFNTVYFSTRPQNKRIQMHLGCHYFCNQ